jgi:hypothetical protein
MLFRTLFIVFLLTGLISAKATHLNGGTITYKYIGVNTYHLIFTAYYDRNPCLIPTPVQAQPNTWLEIYTATGSYYSSVNLPMRSNTAILPYQGSCVPNDTCYELRKVVYSDTVILPTLKRGYHLYYESCCRNGQIDNMTSPTSYGEAFYAYIPKRMYYGDNSSPEWNIDPPTFYCIGNDVNFDNSAYDLDGDSLVYSFYNPFADIDYTAPYDLDFINGQPQFQYINFISPYHANNVLNLNGTDSLKINSNGRIHGIPDNLGYFVAGIRCDEYRNGNLLSSIYRDMRYAVINCPPHPVADFTPIIDCQGSGIVQFTNNTIADDYFWDFDTSFVSNDTSNLFSPSYNYSSGQCFDALLFASNNNGCYSSITLPVCVGVTTANFMLPSPACDSVGLTIINQSTFPVGSNMNFLWTTTQGDTSQSYHPSFNFSSGSVDITLIAQNSNGCSDTLTQNLQVSICNSINEIEREDFSFVFHPNPVKDNFSFESDDLRLVELVIYNNLGQTVSKISLDSHTISVNMSAFPVGMYYLSLKKENGQVLAGKLVKN